MTHLPGNPHYGSAQEFLEDAYFHEGEDSGYKDTQIALQRAEIQSTLALAYELRTANLTNALLVQAKAHEVNMIIGDDVTGHINPRLGFDIEGNPTHD